MAKYAVLISSGKTTTDDVMYHSEYWYDLFLMYRMLIENGFTHDNIYVLYGEGADFNSAHPEYNTAAQFPGVAQITDYPNHEQNVQNIFSWLAAGNAAEGIPALTDNDFLFVWWMGHGASVGPCQMDLVIQNTGEFVHDSTFANYVDVITHYLKRAFLFMTCFSGGMMDNLQGAKTVVETAAPCDTTSASDTFDVVHAEFTYHAACALRRVTPAGAAVPSDFDGNNLVSLDECFTYVSGQPMASVPQISDVSVIAPCIFIKLPTPGKIIEIMSKDHVNDDGTVPSNYETWYHGPDLWVRNLQDGITAHQDPEYGQTNYIYANVHNIGCGTATNINVEFSWCEPTAWANPALWNFIGTVTIPALGSLDSVTVNIPWNNLPLPGVYCLHTCLKCLEDPENAYGEAYMDNNKVQINATVVDDVWNTKKTFWFFVENPIKKRIPIDLEIDASKILDNARLWVELPPGIRFEGVKNAEVIRDRSKKITLRMKRGVSMIKGLSLSPKSMEKPRLFLTLTVPAEAKIGQKSTVTVEEKIKGESKGGIEFISRVSTREAVIKRLLSRRINMFRGIADELCLDEARKVSDLSSIELRVEEWKIGASFINNSSKIVKLEEAVFTSAKFRKLYRISRDLSERHTAALKKLKDALERKDETRLIEAEEEVLLYLSALLAEFIKRKRPSLLKHP